MQSSIYDNNRKSFSKKTTKAGTTSSEVKQSLHNFCPTGPRLRQQHARNCLRLILQSTTAILLDSISNPIMSWRARALHTQLKANANDKEQCQQAKRRDVSEAPIIEGLRERGHRTV